MAAIQNFKMIIFFLVLTLSSTHVYSQNKANLDKKMGFNKFKLESSFETYKSNLTFRIASKKNIQFYDYIGTDIPSVFGVSYDKITLGFYKNRLYTISITFTYTTDQDDETLQTNLSALFGKATTSYDYSNRSEYQWAWQWESEKVLMQLKKYKLATIETPPWSTEIFMNSKAIGAEILNDSF